MFRGLAAIHIDAKGRMTIPAHYRKVIMEEAEGKLVLTIDTEARCLLLYPAPQWQRIEQMLEQLPSFQPATRRIQRLLIGHAHDVELDSHGRVLLPSLLREYAGLERSVMLVGQGHKMEIWGEGQWHLERDRWLSEGLKDGGQLPPALINVAL